MIQKWVKDSFALETRADWWNRAFETSNWGLDIHSFTTGIKLDSLIEWLFLIIPKKKERTKF